MALTLVPYDHPRANRVTLPILWSVHSYNNMSKTLTRSLVVVAVALGLALALNPSAERHREKIKAVIAERSPLEGALGIGHLTSFASKYHSLGIASYTTVNDKTTSVGAFGMVFVSE